MPNEQMTKGLPGCHVVCSSEKAQSKKVQRSPGDQPDVTQRKGSGKNPYETNRK